MLDFESDTTSDVRAASHDVITGCVVDASGRPQPNVTIVGTATGRTSSQRKQTITDASGLFTLDGLQSGERYLILATAMRNSVPLIGRVSTTAPEQQVVIQVSRPFTVQHARTVATDSPSRQNARISRASRADDRTDQAARVPLPTGREPNQTDQRELPWDMPPAPASGEPLWIPTDEPDHDFGENHPADNDVASDQLASRRPDATQSRLRSRVDAAADLASEHAIDPSGPLSWPGDVARDVPSDATARQPLEWKPAAPSSPAAPVRPAPRAYQATTCEFDGNRLVDFQLPDLDLREATFHELPGRLVLIDFWGSWCGYCLKTMPHLVELQRRYGTHGLQVVGIAYEQGRLNDRVERVREIRDQLAINYPLLVADAGTACPVREKFGIQLYPTLVLLDRTGRVLWRSEGSDPRELDRLENLLKTQLADAAKSL